ncbi:MAG: PQQ-like beta-propeller repeat protein, partial [Candidatus Sumerlaeia bacterium]|nr:PQQ-like beta-propeller repeat protein [Candidatus Sumerlaeia bacterium]
MPNPNRRIQGGALLAGLAIGALVAAPNNGFAWPMAGGSSTRDHRITSSPKPLPPLTIKGRYFDEGFSGSERIFLIDGNYLFDSGNLGVAAYDLVEQPDGDGVLSEESRWRYPAEGEFGRLFQPTTQLDGNRVYLSEEVVDFVGPETVEMVRILALSRHNGAVEWDHVIEHARYGKLLLQHNRVYLWHQDRTVESGNPFNGRLVALEPDTGDEFDSTATLFSNESIPLIVSGGLVYLDEGRRISAFNADTLDLEWTYPEGDQPIPGTGEENISNMAFSDGVLYFLYGGQHLFAIDDEGTLLWETDIVEGENCTARGNLAIADDAVLVSRVCFDRLYAVDRETGDVSWSREVEGEYQDDAPLVSNGLAIVGTSGPQFESGDTQIIDITSGEIVSTISYPEMISGRVKAARNGLLYMEASLVGTEVTVVEMEPATLKTSMEGFPDLDCGLYVGQEMSGTVRFTNEGPGLARNTFAIIRDENNSLDVTVDVPDGLDLFESGTGIYRLNLGDVEPGTELEVPVTISPNRPGLVNITTSFVSSVRNPAEEDMADHLRIPALVVPDQQANLEIAAVEVTQGMQDLDGSIELAARKPTLVRVYPESDVDIESLTISMIASRSILDAPTEIEPLETCLAVEAGAFDREDLSRSFNFLLPNRLLFNEHGEPVTLEITLDPTEGLDLVDRSAAQETVEVYYNTTSPICLLTYAVKTEDSEREILIPSSRLPENVRERAEAMLPTPEIRAYRRNTVISKGIVRSEPYNLDIGDSARFVRESRVVSKLWLQRTTSNVPHDCDRDDASVHYLGIVGEDVYTSPDVSGRFNGFANMPGSALLVRMRDLDESGLNSPLAGVTLAHELGHNFGRTHVACGGPAAAWSNIPYDPCTLGPIGDSTSFFGVDLLDPTDP